MSISVADFWRLLAESRLLSPEETRRAADELAGANPAAAGDLQLTAKGLLKAGKLSRHQAKILLSGKAGPFVYGDYVVYDRAEGPRLAGLFRARHRPSGHPVCLHFLSGPALENPQAIARLMPQAAVARQASQRQPRLSACHQFVDLGHFKFLAVENLVGHSLSERLEKPDSKRSISLACRLVRLAALGLAQLHSLGQAHGHVRPANVWLDEAGAAKLMQFPFIADPLAPKMPPATIAAQLDYLAPEQAAPGALAEARGDVYSLGCLLYALLAGQPPFAGGDRQSKLVRHAQEAPAPITKLNPEVPAALAQVLNYLLQKDPAKRYPDAAAVAEALRAYSGGDPPLKPAPTLAAYEAWLERAERGELPASKQPAPVAATAQVAGANGAAPQAARMPAPAPLAAAAARPLTAAVQPIPAAAYPAGQPQPVRAAAPVVPAINVTAPAANPTIAPTAGAASVARRRSKKQGQTAATVGVIAAAAGMLGGAVWFLQSLDTSDGPQPGAPSTVTRISEQEIDAKPLDAHLADVDNAVQEPVQGIGQAIWQSPTADGKPLNLSWLPPGVQVVLALRPAELTKQSEWEKLIDPRTLGTLSRWLTDDLPKSTGKTLDRLESVVVGLLDGSPGPPRVALVARSNEEFKADELKANWGDAKPEEIEGQVVQVQAGRAYYLPASGADKLLVVAPAVELREMLKMGGEPPALRREVEVLLDSSDDRRHLTLLMAPNFPLTDGKGLFVDEGAKLLEPLRMFLEMEDSDGKLELSKAALFSGHLGESLFVEMRLYDNFGKPAQSAARELQRRVAQLPKQVSGYVRDLQLSSYSKPVLWDYKDQLDVLEQYTRLGVEGKQIVLRAYLPVRAAHNLALGAHLALLENSAGGTTFVAASRSAPQAGQAQSVADKLKKTTTLTFPRNTLEQSMKLLGDDLGLEIVILGNDLRDEGITKNQSFGLDEKDQPAGDILRKIMKLSNPDGKLVYVIKPKEGGGEDILYVTTRAAAKKRGDKLPPELENAK